jgi:hypothetical protein
VQLHATDYCDNGGLRWIADHRNPYFILAYFYYLGYRPNDRTFLQDIREKNEERWQVFKGVLDNIKVFMKNKFHITRGKLVFDTDFKNPFQTQIMEVEELKKVIHQIVSKLLIFCLF